MAKQFKLRIYKVITTTFQSCRSKDPSTLPQNPVPSFFRFTPLLPHFPTDHRRNVSTRTTSFACGFSSTSSSSTKKQHRSPDHHLNTTNTARSSSSPQRFKWRKEEKWHVIAKIHEQNQTPPRHPVAEERKKRRVNNKKKKKKISSSRLHVSTSSTEESGLFSNEEEEEEEETEILVSSSRSFYSTDTSSSSTRRRHSRKKKTYNNYKKPSTKRRSSSSPPVCGEGGSDSPARLSVFKKLIPCTVEGKVRDSFAIVKKSDDPYEDFKRSMIEMILEKQMFEEKDLEQLLQCFLSLNSRHYHGIIVEAFADIWEAMFFCSIDDDRQLQRRRLRPGLAFQ